MNRILILGCEPIRLHARNFEDFTATPLLADEDALKPNYRNDNAAKRQRAAKKRKRSKRK